MTGRKDGETLFHRIFLATTEGPTNTTAINWHLKVKDNEYNIIASQSACKKLVQFITLFLRHNKI